jgi:hypothetical protein
MRRACTTLFAAGEGQGVHFTCIVSLESQSNYGRISLKEQRFPIPYEVVFQTSRSLKLVVWVTGETLHSGIRAVRFLLAAGTFASRSSRDDVIVATLVLPLLASPFHLCLLMYLLHSVPLLASKAAIANCLFLNLYASSCCYLLS